MSAGIIYLSAPLATALHICSVQQMAVALPDLPAGLCSRPQDFTQRDAASVYSSLLVRGTKTA